MGEMVQTETASELKWAAGERLHLQHVKVNNSSCVVQWENSVCTSMAIVQFFKNTKHFLMNWYQISPTKSLGFVQHIKKLDVWDIAVEIWSQNLRKLKIPQELFVKDKSWTKPANL